MATFLIRLLALLGLLWTGKQAVHQVSSVLRPNQDEKKENLSDQETGGEMVKDPICQTYIPKSLAIRKTLRGETYYFCGDDCASTFSDQHRGEA